MVDDGDGGVCDDDNHRQANGGDYDINIARGTTDPGY